MATPPPPHPSDLLSFVQVVADVRAAKTLGHLVPPNADVVCVDTTTEGWGDPGESGLPLVLIKPCEAFMALQCGVTVANLNWLLFDRGLHHGLRLVLRLQQRMANAAGWPLLTRKVWRARPDDADPLLPSALSPNCPCPPPTAHTIFVTPRPCPPTACNLWHPPLKPSFSLLPPQAHPQGALPKKHAGSFGCAVQKATTKQRRPRSCRSMPRQ